MELDEVLALPNSELQVKAARLFVGREEPVGDEDGDWYFMGTEREFGWGDSEEFGMIFLPDYLNDIAAAWKLWEQIPYDRAIERYRSIHGIECVTVKWEPDPNEIFQYLWQIQVALSECSIGKAITQAFVFAMTQEELVASK